MTPEPNFDLIARPYRWLEYLTLGRTLERCRTHFLPLLPERRSALVLGDGDGRFVTSLLVQNPHLHADALDTSATMLKLLIRRAHTQATNAANRLQTHHTNALTFTPVTTYDLIATHFFLDCLPQIQVDQLIANLSQHLQPHALWLISDFRIPAGPMQPIARIFVRSLYLAFRILTGLRTTRLPDHATPLANAGFTRIAHHHFLAGLLTTELWQATK